MGGRGDDGSSGPGVNCRINNHRAFVIQRVVEQSVMGGNGPTHKSYEISSSSLPDNLDYKIYFTVPVRIGFETYTIKIESKRDSEFRVLTFTNGLNLHVFLPQSDFPPNNAIAIRVNCNKLN